VKKAGASSGFNVTATIEDEEDDDDDDSDEDYDGCEETSLEVSFFTGPSLSPFFCNCSNCKFANFNLKRQFFLST